MSGNREGEESSRRFYILTYHEVQIDILPTSWYSINVMRYF